MGCWSSFEAGARDANGGAGLLVAVGVSGLPALGIPHHFLDPEVRAPVQLRLRQRGIGMAGGDISGASLDDHEGYRATVMVNTRVTE